MRGTSGYSILCVLGNAVGHGDEVAKTIVAFTYIMPFAFANDLFVAPLQNGQLNKLLSRSTAAEVISIKYVSALSMTLFVVTIPGLMVRDVRFLLHVNCGMLLLAAVCMAIAVVLPNSWAPLAPIWLVAVPYVFLPQYADKTIDWFTHSNTSEIAALCTIPVLVLLSTIIFNIQTAKAAKSRP